MDNVIPLAIRELTAAEEEEELQKEAEIISANYMQTHPPKELLDLQLNDPDINPIITWLGDSTNPIEGELFLQSAATHMWLCKSTH